MSTFPANDMGYLRSLEGVKVGDSFMYWEGRYDCKLVRVQCTAISPKQCVIGRHKYRISDARALGGDSWNRPPSLMRADEKELEADREKQLLVAMRRTLSDFRWKDIPDETIKAIYNLATTAASVIATKG